MHRSIGRIVKLRHDGPAVQFIQYHKVSGSTSCYYVGAPYDGPAVRFIQYHKVSRSTSCYQVRAPQARCRRQTPVLFGNEDKVRATEMMVLLTLTRWTTKKHVINNASGPPGSLGLGKFHPDIGTAHQFFHTPVFHAPTKKRPAARSKIQYAVSLLHNVAFRSFW